MAHINGYDFVKEDKTDDTSDWLTGVLPPIPTQGRTTDENLGGGPKLGDENASLLWVPEESSSENAAIQGF